MRKIDLHRVAELNSECISFDDRYSEVEVLKGTKQLQYIVVDDPQKKHVGYLIYRVLKTHIESIRRGVTRSERRKGYGSRLTKALIKVAEREGKPIYTYVSKSNLPSLNGNLKMGYTVEDISDHWVYIAYRPRVA